MVEITLGHVKEYIVSLKALNDTERRENVERGDRNQSPPSHLSSTVSQSRAITGENAE